MPNTIALKVNDKDNVAVAFTENLLKGDTVGVRDQKGSIEEVALISDIPYGHKLAIVDIEVDTPIYKYGEEIGITTSNIKKGQHVHVHNLDSQRSRGDKEII